MKIIITEDQVNLLNEGTNKSVRLLKKYYDIIGGGGRYEGQGKIRTDVSFLRKDSDDDLNHSSFPSYGFWAIGDDDQLIFRSVTLPKPENIPLMEYIGNTDELKEYLKDLHREEAEDILKRINHRRENPLNESVDKKKKFLINVMGHDFTGKIKEVKDQYDVPMSFDEGVGPNLINRWLNHWGPMYLVNVNGKNYLYQDRGDFEMFIDEEGYDYVDGEVLEEIGIGVLGLKFSDIIDMFFEEGEPLNESVDKNKKFLINIMGEDLTGKIKEIKGRSDIPKIFHRYLDLNGVKRQIEMVGPMYVVKIGGNYYLYQDQSHFYQSHNDASFGEMFMDEDGKRDRSGKILKELGIDVLGLRFKDIIDMFYNEGKPLNEEENDKPDWLRENTKVKNLLKKVLENKEFKYSFKDKWEDLDGHIETYTFYYHIEILNAIGVGSDTIARVQVIIDDVLLDGESVYDGWVEIGYSNNVWYIDNLEKHLDEEFFDVFPFSIYVNFYGHDEER